MFGSSASDANRMSLGVKLPRVQPHRAPIDFRVYDLTAPIDKPSQDVADASQSLKIFELLKRQVAGLDQNRISIQGANSKQSQRNLIGQLKDIGNGRVPFKRFAGRGQSIPGTGKIVAYPSPAAARVEATWRGWVGTEVRVVPPFKAIT